jgi:YedE family putative selenium metabolism protein
MPLLGGGLLLLRFLCPEVPGETGSGVLLYSLKGPGARHAPLLISLGIGLLAGVMAQRSRFCTMGALRDLILFRHWNLFSGFPALLAGAWLVNLILGQLHPRFEGQPVAHTQGFWNFSGMLVAGLAFALAGGCPGRQPFLSGEGDGDAAISVFGMIVGAAFAHNFALASSPKGIGPHGMTALVVSLLVCLWIEVTNLNRELKQGVFQWPMRWMQEGSPARNLYFW